MNKFACHIVLIALVAAVTKHAASHVLCVLAGLMPFVILCYGLYDEGADLLKVLEIGAWIGFGSGLALIVLGAV